MDMYELVYTLQTVEQVSIEIEWQSIERQSSVDLVSLLEKCRWRCCLRVDQESIEGVDEHLTMAAFTCICMIQLLHL